MAQVVPNLTSLPIDSTAAPSVEDIQARLPSICVDYLSHDWAEEDVWASWRSMTRHKNEIANGVRLENASWRTWWKQRNKLKTISPETLNWLKDSDVTWLYGPLHTAVEPVPPPKVATAEERLGLSRADSATHRHGDLQPTKPILKHRTLSEMLSIPNPSSPILEAVRAEDVDDHELDESRPILLHTKSDTNIVTKGHHQRRKSPPRGPIGSGGSRTPVSGPSSSGSRTPTMDGGEGGAAATTMQGTTTPAPPPPLQQQPSKKHISFNTFVEQCIAVDDPDEIAGIEGHARDEAGLVDDEEDDSDSDDDDDDAMLEMKSVSSAASSSARSNSIRSNSTRSSRPSLSRHGSQASSQPDHMTIAKIAPTTLKTLGDFPSPSPQLAYAPTGDYATDRRVEQDQADQQVVAFKNQAAGGYPIPVNPGGGAGAGAGAAGGGGRDSSVSPQSVGSPTWDDEDDYAVGFDYFSGPDLGVGDEYDTAAKRGPAASSAAAAVAVGANPTRTVQSHVGSAGHYGGSNNKTGSAAAATPTPTVVGQVPAQPKWRSGSASSSGATTPSGSGNTSGAGSPASTAKPSPGSQSPTSPDFANISSPPQPGRSILKIRPPGSQQGFYEPETSPTNSHFNWKPSAATGQGGLESGVRRVIKEPVAGSLPSYDVNDSYFVQSGGGGAGNETPPLQSATASATPVTPTSPGVVVGRDGESRGRSAVRTGANVAERSASRSVTGASGSTAAATSISPSSSRTAVQAPTAAAASPAASAKSSSSATKSDASNTSSSTPKSPPLANETPSAPQVQRAVGLGGVMPKDDVDMKREQQAKEQQQEERSDDVDDRTAEYVPDRGSTPTPHSSPQVAIRPLVDTSPASLPHAQTVHVAGKKQATGGVSAAEQTASTLKAQNSVTLGGVRRHQRGASVGSTGSGSSSSLGSGFFKSSLSQQQVPPTEEDAGLISNITTTARDLFGALWTYGGQTGGSSAPGNVSREPSSRDDNPES